MYSQHRKALSFQAPSQMNPLGFPSGHQRQTSHTHPFPFLRKSRVLRQETIISFSSPHSGKVYSAATTSDGNTFGQLGVETSPESPLLTPYTVTPLEHNSITAIAAGERHSLALTSRGEVYSWGSNAQGQLLQQYSKNNYVTPTPTLVPLQRTYSWNSKSRIDCCWRGKFVSCCVCEWRY